MKEEKKITESAEFHNLESKAHAYKFGKENWSDWGLLFHFLVIIAKILEKSGSKKQKRTRKFSPYNKFVSEQMKLGKSMKEISELWKARK